MDVKIQLCPILAVDLCYYLWCFSWGNMLQVKIQSKFSSTSFKEPSKIPGSVVEIVRSVMIYIFILTTTLFVLHAIKTPYYFKSCLW